MKQLAWWMVLLDLTGLERERITDMVGYVIKQLAWTGERTNYRGWWVMSHP